MTLQWFALSRSADPPVLVLPLPLTAGMETELRTVEVAAENKNGYSL